MKFKPSRQELIDRNRGRSIEVGRSTLHLGWDGTGGRYLYVPAGFDAEAILGERLARYADCARYVLHRIRHKTRKDRRYWELETLEFVPLNADRMIKMFTGRHRSYYPVMERLVESGTIIKSPKKPIPGVESQGYKLSPELDSRRAVMVEITDWKLARQIRKRNEELIRLRDLPIHRRMLADKVQQLEIDYDAALEALQSRGDYRPDDELAIRMIRDGIWNINERDPYGRFHSNLTNLRTEMRRFLTYRGQHLVNLDIRNSQPLMFALLLREQYQGMSIPADVGRYVRLCEEGEFYDYLMREGGIAEGGRSAFKKKFFEQVFFGRNRGPESNQYASYRLFKEVFPNVAGKVWDMKEPAKRDEYRDEWVRCPELYAELARELQRTESGLMIDKIARRCLFEMPEAFIATIHDSILTTPDMVRPVWEIMREEFLKVGMEPTINPEHYGEQPSW